MEHDPLCDTITGNDWSLRCDCKLIRTVREDERGKSGDCMCPHPNVECQHPTCPRGVPEVRAAALRDAAEAVKAMCQDCDDIVAAIEALGGESHDA